MFKFKEGDLLDLLKHIPAGNMFRPDRVTTTLGTMYVAHEDSDMVYSHALAVESITPNKTVSNP